eukprot:m.201916 g.201916  ORF g.201916 m.201916 type:complete len:726 (+) comp18807_c0_seq5:167-2344(+)
MMFSLSVVLLIAVQHAKAQSSGQSAIAASGNQVTINVPSGGQVNIQYGQDPAIAVATNDDVVSATALLMDEMQAIINNVTILQNQNAELMTYKRNSLACAVNGLLYSESSATCVAPMPNVSSFATATRMTNAENDIIAIETALNGTNGTHSFCQICPQNHYVSTPCHDGSNTVCSPCPNGQWSLGGFTPTCTSCAEQVENCGFALCQSSSDAVCQFCSQDVVLGTAYVLAGQNNCTACGPYTYRSDNTTCTPCPKDSSCAAATCQANTGSPYTEAAGVPSIKSFYNLGVMRTQAQYQALLAQYSDEVTVGSAIHGGTTGTDLINPWFQVDLGQNVQFSINNLAFWNRDDYWRCRLFAQNGGVCGGVQADTSRVWNGTNEGAVFGVSDSPISTFAATARDLPMCTSAVQANCKCAYLTQYNPSSRLYTINCNDATGRYVFLVLPGVNRMMNFAEFKIMGNYAVTSPTVSTCVEDCMVSSCEAGQASCPATPGTAAAQCAAGGCISTVTGGVGYGFVTGGTCSVCTTSQYVNSNGVCQACPASCGGGACQADSVVTGGTATQSSTYAAQYSADVARRDTTSFTHTQGNNNAWWQLQLDATEYVKSVVVTLRRDACGARSLQSTNGCSFNPGNVPYGNQFDRDYNATNEGTVVRVASAACTAGQICPGTICGSIFRPQNGNPYATYTVTCPSPIQGNFVSVQVPGNNRLQQLNQVVVNRDVTLTGPTC